MAKAIKKQNSLYKKMGVIAGYIVYPVIILAIVGILTIVASTPAGQVPSLFGTSILKIQTGSMAEDGYLVGNVVFITQEFENPLQPGDIVAFYNIEDVADSIVISQLERLEDWDGIITGEDNTIGGRTTKYDLEEADSYVYFHYVRDVFVSPDDGTIFYQTAGAGELTTADGYIRQDFIVGNYITTPFILQKILGFFTTAIGMIILVVFPLSLLVLLECLSLIEQVNRYMYDNKLFNREIEIENEYVKKYNIAKEMELPRKVYFMATSKQQDIEKNFNFMFEYLNEEESSNKDKNTYKIAKQSMIMLKHGNLAQYFSFWHSKIDGRYNKKEIQKFKKQYEYTQIVKNVK